MNELIYIVFSNSRQVIVFATKDKEKALAGVAQNPEDRSWISTTQGSLVSALSLAPRESGFSSLVYRPFSPKIMFQGKLEQCIAYAKERIADELHLDIYEIATSFSHKLQE